MMQAGSKKVSGQAEESKETKTTKAAVQEDTKAEAKKAEVKKEEVKKAEPKKSETKNVEVKTVAKAEAKKTEPKKEAVQKEEPIKEAVAKKEPASVEKESAKAVKKVIKAKKTVKEPVVPEVKLQYDDENGGHEADLADIVAKIKAAYVAEGHRESSIKLLRVYVKPQDWKAYYVINNKIEGQIDLF